jgi:hypothetical protein
LESLLVDIIGIDPAFIADASREMKSQVTFSGIGFADDHPRLDACGVQELLGLITQIMLTHSL